MTALLERLKEEIAASGPLTLADYMARALGDPQAGYYRHRDPFGAAGDFTTAPEMSQLFGELIGLWCLDQWRRSGRPSPVRLVELGPGRGTLMNDLLRAAGLDPAFRSALDLHLVETSPHLVERQRAALAEVKATWHEDFESIPQGTLLLLANEFFDALPIRQYRRSAEGWRERLIGLDPSGAELVFEEGPPGPVEGLPDAPIAEGTLAEVSPAGRALVRFIAARLVRCGGAALIVDYGRLGPFGDSLQAVRGHRAHPPLAAPGEADLSAHVDFAALKAAALDAGARPFGPEPQGRFLKALGIEPRAAQLIARATPRQAREIRAARARLTDPLAMGALFKVLAFTGPHDPPPAGFPPCAAK